MGAICPCFGQKPEYTYSPVPTSDAERTPLLSSGSFGTPKPRAPSTASARLHSSSDPPEKRFEEKDIRKLTVQDVGVPDLDKQFKDHSALYNEYIDKYRQVKENVKKMTSVYDEMDTPGNVAQVFSILKGELDEEAMDSLQIKRKYKYCMEINFEAKYMSEKSVTVLDCFNRANRLIKDLVDKGPMLVQSVSLVVDNEEHAKRDVTVYYSEEGRTKKGPEKLRVCLENLSELKRVKPAVTYVTSEATKHFDDLQHSAQILLK